MTGLLPLLLATALLPQDTTHGQRIYAAVCSACHSLNPPPLQAPPLSHVAHHYRSAAPDQQAAVQRVAAWLAAPDSSRSLLPAQARQRWGLMPPLVLPPQDALAVAHYVISLADSSQGQHGGRGPRFRGGRGGGSHLGSPRAIPDTTSTRARLPARNFIRTIQYEF